MAIHTDLQVHRTASDLYRVVIGLVRNLPRDIKQLAGKRLHDESLAIMTLIGRANMASDKARHLQAALESVWTIEVIMRTLVDDSSVKAVSHKQHAETMHLTASISRQVNAWRKSQPRPLREG